ncbi:MAG TPA: sn-glycerol-3-phosphate ABC transporter ATP-binding protein UgpC, partial [Beijerinckiaceae bacterium]|nr:sn-glycerol-3-phosphate ABC transporter ATP-binding protein UgpC [Beijerinckiaceae bacterium]
VSFVEELGATQLFHGKVGGDEFVVQAPTGEIPVTTSQLALAVDAGNVHLFDPVTGERLGRVPSH